MIRTLVIDEAAQEEADAQAAYYAEHAGGGVALRFVAKLEAIYRGLMEARFVGVNHPRVRFRVPVKRVFMDRFPFAVVFFVEDKRSMLLRSRRSSAVRGTGERAFVLGECGASCRRHRSAVALRCPTGAVDAAAAAIPEPLGLSARTSRQTSRHEHSLS